MLESGSLNLNSNSATTSSETMGKVFEFLKLPFFLIYKVGTIIKFN